MKFSEVRTYSEADIPTKGVGRGKSEFFKKIEALDVWQGFEVTGMNRNNVSSRINVIGRKLGREYTTRKSGDGILIVRIA